jgi:hypothetical protein
MALTTNAFREAVSKGNVREIRIMLKDSLLVDPTFARFNKMEKAASEIPGLYDNHDGRSFINNSDEWTDEYMDKIMVQVVGNFSHERVDHLKAVVRKLRPVHQTTSHSPQGSSHANKKTNRNVSLYQEQKKKDQQTGSYKYAVGIGGGALAGGIVGYAGGSLAALPVGGIIGCTISGAVVGTAVGRAIVYFTSEKEQSV